MPAPLGGQRGALDLFGPVHGHAALRFPLAAGGAVKRFGGGVRPARACARGVGDALAAAADWGRAAGLRPRRPRARAETQPAWTIQPPREDSRRCQCWWWWWWSCWSWRGRTRSRGGQPGNRQPGGEDGAAGRRPEDARVQRGGEEGDGRRSKRVLRGRVGVVRPRLPRHAGVPHGNRLPARGARLPRRLLRCPLGPPRRLRRTGEMAQVLGRVRGARARRPRARSHGVVALAGGRPPRALGAPRLDAAPVLSRRREAPRRGEKETAPVPRGGGERQRRR
mmetsp:Transcript_64417/g.110615  ORF Transcript_64417/g.110615 Transcript_64417/m.110615 type:complete len:280 (-) Transcript_64417:487-1326(-)